MPSLMTDREREYELFETPPEYTIALLDTVQVRGTVIEPCAGHGAITRVLQHRGLTVWSNDLDRQMKADWSFDATAFWPPVVMSKGPQWVITNPPFSSARAIIERARRTNIPNMACLVRLSFLEPTEDRAEFLEAHPPDHLIVLPRVSFRPNAEGKRQTDTVTCCWLVWALDPPARPVTVWGRAKIQAHLLAEDL